eukprot:763578-Hanusia_phi.AAC.3
MSNKNNTLLSQFYTNEALTARGLDGYRQKHDQFKLGAIAELIDNAMEAQSDEVHLNIDEENDILEVLDDGVGVPREVIKSMVIMGKGNKTSKNNYGVGFKCGSLGVGNDVLVLSKTVECDCGVYFKLIQGDDAKCTCKASEKRHVRSLIYLTAGSRLEGEHETLKIPMIFWRGDGKALVEEADLKTMPEKEEKEISDVGVTDLTKFIYKNFHLHSLRAIQKQFDRIKETGTLVLIAHLNDNELAQQIQLDKSRFDITATQGDSQPMREDRKPPFPHDTDVPQDYCLRAYCEMLYAHTSHKETRRRTRIFIVGKEVEKRSVQDMCEPKELVSYPRELKAHNKTHKLEIKLGFSPDACTRRVCGFFVYFDKGHKQPPRLILAYHRVGLMTNKVGKVNGLVGEVILSHELVRVDQGKQRFESSSMLKDVDKVLSDAIDLYEKQYQQLRDALDEQLKQQDEAKASHGSIVWAQYTDFGKFRHWPGVVLNRYDREVMRFMSEELFQPRKGNSFPRGPLPSHFLVKCYETNEVLWCKVEDVVPFDNKDGRKMKKASKDVDAKYRELVKVAIKMAEEDQRLTYAKLTCLRVRCSECTKWRMSELPKGELDDSSWSCDQGFKVGNELKYDCNFPQEESVLNEEADLAQGVPPTRAEQQPLEPKRSAAVLQTPLPSKVKSEETHEETAESNGKRKLIATMTAQEFVSRHQSDLLEWESVENLSVEQDGQVRILAGEWRAKPVKIREYKQNNLDCFVKDFRVMKECSSHGIVHPFGFLHKQVHGGHELSLMIRCYHSVKSTIRDGKLDTSLTCRLGVMEQVCQALSELHAKDLFLANLSWDSILLDSQNVPFLSDFAHVQEASSEMRWGQVTMSCGAASRRRMKKRDDAPVTRRDLMLLDLYNLGVLMHCVGYGRELDVFFKDRLDLENIPENGELIRHDSLLEIIADCVSGGHKKVPKDVESVKRRIGSLADKKAGTQKLEALLTKLEKEGKSSDRSFICYKILDAQDVVMLQKTCMVDGIVSSCFGCDPKPTQVVAPPLRATDLKESNELMLVRDWKFVLWNASSIEHKEGFLPVVLVVDLRKLGPTSSLRVCDLSGRLLRMADVRGEEQVVKVKGKLAPQAVVGVWDWSSESFKQLRKSMQKSQFPGLEAWRLQLDKAVRDPNNLLDDLEADPSCNALEKLKRVVEMHGSRERLAAEVRADWVCLKLGHNQLLIGEFDQRIMYAEDVSFAINLFARDHMNFGFTGGTERFDSSLCIVHFCYQRWNVRSESNKDILKDFLVGLSDLFLPECIEKRKLFVHRDRTPAGQGENLWYVFILIVMMRKFGGSLSDARKRFADEDKVKVEVHPLHLSILRDIETDLQSGNISTPQQDRLDAYKQLKKKTQELLSSSKRDAVAAAESQSAPMGKKSRLTEAVGVKQETVRAIGK